MERLLYAERYLNGEQPQWLVKPNMRGRPPVFVQHGFAVHPSTSGLGESLMDRDRNVYVNAHPAKRPERFLRDELEYAKDKARRLYARHISEGLVRVDELEALLARIPLAAYAEARSLIMLVEVGARIKEPITVAAHSFGAQSALFAAFLRPDLFPNQGGDKSTLVLLNPAGFTGKRESAEQREESKALAASEAVRAEREQGLLETFRGLGRAGALQLRHLFSVIGAALTRGAEGRRAFKEAILYTATHLLSGTADSEAHAMANTDMVPYANFLATSGIRLEIVYDEDDVTFPARVFNARREGKEFDERIGFHKTKGKGHFGPVHDPEGTAKLVDDILKNEDSSQGGEK